MAADTPPKEWSDMGNKDLDVVPLPDSGIEYQQVAESFRKTVDTPSVQIIKIERVQNLTLYRQYMAMKRQIASNMSKGHHCERDQLWHGTKEESVDGIIKNGFNRSYSDRNKSAYGLGVYFATEAQYSTRDEYAKANSAGDRNMFRCKVLVGEYTKGKQGLRFPPDMPSPDQGRHYNSTVDNPEDPKIFVVFSDVQAYPEYRIVFRDR